MTDTSHIRFNAGDSDGEQLAKLNDLSEEVTALKDAGDVAIDTAAEAERIRDVIGAALVAGSNVTITVNDAGDTITIAASGGSGGGRTLIEEYIGDGTASTKTFSAIPGAGTYRSIELEIFGRVTAAVLSRPIQIIVNGLTTSIYDSQIHYGNNATSSASQSLGAANITNVFELPGTSTSSGDVAGGSMVFLNHAGTVFNKLFYANARQAASTTTHSAFSVNSHGQVRLTAAITSLTATVATGGNFDTGTVIRLYGRA